MQSASEDLLASDLLKQRLDDNPNQKIPELRYLTGKDWLRLTQEARLRDEDPSDDQVLSALSTIRCAAKQQLVYWMQPALQAYLQANSGQLPTEVTQLEPYFNQFNCPVDDATLERYQMLKTGSVNDLPPGALVIGEKAGVDNQYDTLWQIGLTNFSGMERARMPEFPGVKVAGRLTEGQLSQGQSITGRAFFAKILFHLSHPGLFNG